jgi:preprotein translocase subunit SecD
MYRVSVWKLVLIIVVLLFSALYLIPTPDSLYNPLYGNLPLWMQERLPKFEPTNENSLKVNLQNVKFPEGVSFNEARTQLEDVLEIQLRKSGFEKGTDYEFISTQQREFFVKFLSEKSSEELRAILKNLSLYGGIPTSVRRLIPDNRLKLGLDLKGGVRLVLEVDVDESKIELLKERAVSIPERLRAENIHSREAEILADQSGLNVVVGIPKRISDENERKAYLKKAREVLEELEFFGKPQGIEETDSQATYQIRLDEAGLKRYSEQAIDQVLVVLRNRVDAFGVAEPSIRQEANRPRIIVELPGAKDSSKPLQIVKTMGRLEFKLVAKSPTGASAWAGPGDAPPPDNLPLGVEVRYHYETGDWYVLHSPVLLTGERITDAGPTQGSTSFDVVVGLNFDTQGRRKFAEITGNHIGERLAILLDGTVQSAPVIRDKIVGGAVIEGNFTFEEANYLSNILKAGAFPVGVRVAEERTVGPTLGQEAINNGIVASILGMGFVLVFMVIYYKASGLIAVVALAFNMLMIVAALAGFGASLTLPGLAGLVLTIGMAVDANVLIFERIRDELRTGKTVWSAIIAGYQRTTWTILDANFTTLAVALVLYQFGTGPIKGFAVTLGIGIVASIFTALVVTQEMYGWLVGNRKVKRLSI